MRLAKRILITNYILDQGSGTEMYVHDLALSLLSNGRLPIVYCPRPGLLFRRLQELGVCVVDDLAQIGAPPDVIHGHHSLETIAAAMRFPMCPTLFVCHDCSTWYDTAPSLPNIIKYVAVDQACYDRMVFQHGISPDQLQIIPNGVDLSRFPLRAGLPARPRSILCFGHSFREEYVEQVRQAAPAFHVESIGISTNRNLVEPGPWLGKFDIILARGRSAREAIATGAATIVADIMGVGDMVTSNNYSDFQTNNFGRRLLRKAFSVESVRGAVAQYDAEDAWQVAIQHRQQNSLAEIVQLFESIYDQLLDDFRPESVPSDAWSRHASKWLQWSSLHANVVLPSQPNGQHPKMPPIEEPIYPESEKNLSESSTVFQAEHCKDSPTEESFASEATSPEGEQKIGEKRDTHPTSIRLYRVVSRTLEKLRKIS